MVRVTFVRRVRDEVGGAGHADSSDHSARSRRVRRTGLAVALAGVVAAGCSGPQVPLSVGLADRPVDLLLGQRAAAVAEAPVPPVAIPPSVLPDFDLPLPAPYEFDFTAAPPTSAFTFPSWAPTTTTLPAGCVATPPARTFDDSPDNIFQPPVATPDGEKGYLTRTEGQISIDSGKVAGTLLPTLTNQRVENVQVLSRFPAGYQYQNAKPASGAPADFTYDVVVDVGKPESNTRTTYRVQPAHQKVVYQDNQTWIPWGGNGIGMPVGVADGVADDFYTDRNGDGDVYDAGEQYADQNGNGQTDWDPDPVTHKNDYGFIDVNLSGSIGDHPEDNPYEYFYDTNGNGKIDLPDEQHLDVNHDGDIDYPAEENYANYHYEYLYAPDGIGDSPSITKVGGGFYLTSMLTGTKEQNRISFTKVKDQAGALVDASGAKIATLPFVESATINTEAFTIDGSMSIKFESTVFGRVDVDVCRTDLVAWKVALDRGFIANTSQAMDFQAEYSIASQHGGIFLQDKSVVTSIQAGAPSVKRTIASVYTTEPAAAADPDPPSVG